MSQKDSSNVHSIQNTIQTTELSNTAIEFVKVETNAQVECFMQSKF